VAMRRPYRRPAAGASADERDVLRLGSLLALGNLELDLLPFLKGAVATPVDRAGVHEHVGDTFELDEAVAPFSVEPLHVALPHPDVLCSGCGPGGEHPGPPMRWRAYCLEACLGQHLGRRVLAGRRPAPPNGVNHPANPTACGPVPARVLRRSSRTTSRQRPW